MLVYRVVSRDLEWSITGEAKESPSSSSLQQRRPGILIWKQESLDLGCVCILGCGVTGWGGREDLAESTVECEVHAGLLLTPLTHTALPSFPQ